MPRKLTSRQLAIEIARVCDEKKADDIVVLDLRKLTFVTDFFVIASAQSSRQSRAIGDELARSLKPRGVQLVGSSGLRKAKWGLLDYGEVVCHVFLDSQREFYDLESHWADAPKISWKRKKTKTPSKKKKVAGR